MTYKRTLKEYFILIFNLNQMLIKWIIPCFPRGPWFIHRCVNRGQPAEDQRLRMLLIVLGNVYPILGRQVIKNRVEATFSTVTEMA